MPEFLHIERQSQMFQDFLLSRTDGSKSSKHTLPINRMGGYSDNMTDLRQLNLLPRISSKQPATDFHHKARVKDYDR